MTFLLEQFLERFAIVKPTAIEPSFCVAAITERKVSPSAWKRASAPVALYSLSLVFTLLHIFSIGFKSGL